MAPLSPGDLVTELRRRLRDTAGTNQIWTTLELLDGLSDAAQDLSGAFWVDEIYESIQLNPNQRVYPLPSYIQRVRLIERELLNYPSGAASNYVRWQELRHWHHVPDQQTNQIVVDAPIYQAERTRLYYERDLPITWIQSTAATSVTATAKSLLYSDTVNPIWKWPVPGYVRSGNEIIRYEAVTSTSFTGLTRGMFGTGVKTATTAFGLLTSSPGVVEPVWAQEFHPAHNALVSTAIRNLLMQRLLSGDQEGNRSLGALATQWDRMADAARRSDSMRHLPRSLRSRPQSR